ncbi:MAG: primosomal protein N' [Elusimicrobiota bacterium]
MYAEVFFSIPIEKGFIYDIPDRLISAAKPGVRVLAPFSDTLKRGYITSIFNTLPDGIIPAKKKIKEIKKVIDEIPPVKGDLLVLAKWLSVNYICSMGEALDCIFPLNYPALKDESIKSKNYNSAIIQNAYPVNPPEKSIYSGMILKMANKNNPYFSLEGFNVYERENEYVYLIKEILSNNNGGVIIIYPDKLSAENLALRLRVEFGNSVGVLHSGLTGRRKVSVWNECLGGKLKILLGTRMAVFAPLSNLKLMIIENEGNELHKNQQKPFYDTLGVARERAKHNGSFLLTGAFIPTINTLYNTDTGKNISVIKKKKLPEVAIALLKKTDRLLSPVLRDEIEKRLLKNELSIVFSNRRGFSGAVTCPLCGNIPLCPRCGISMVYHKKEGNLKCHYCSNVQKFTEKCSNCGGLYYYIGTGTERLEGSLLEIFPQAKVLRIDSDSLAYENTRQRLANCALSGRADILVVTSAVVGFYRELIRSGFNKITLVAVTDTDSIAYFPDYRATERAFILLGELSQILNNKGLLILQTRNSEGEFFRCAADFDWKSCYFRDISYRQQLGYPPASKLINLIMRSKSEKKLEKYSQEVYDFLSDEISPVNASLIGPDEPLHNKIRGEYRRHILIKVYTEKLDDVSRAIKSLKHIPGIKISADVNPCEIT